MAVPKSLINQKDLDRAVVNFEKVVKNVVDNGDGIQQAKLLKKLKELTKFMLARKEPKSVETMEVSPSKRIRVNPTRHIEIPNEIWLKIMNYLPTKDILGTFAILNKRSSEMTKDSRALKYLSIDNQLIHRFGKCMEVLKHSTGLVGLSIKDCDKWKEIVKKVLDSDMASLKSLEVSINSGYFCDSNYCDDYHGTQFPIEFIQSLNVSKIKLHTLKIKGFIIDSKVMIEISKMESLKNLSILDTKENVLYSKVIKAFACNDNQLETIEIVDRKKNKYHNDDDDDFDDVHGFFTSENEDKKYRTALNKLFEKKKSVLKSIKMLNLGDPTCKLPKKPCVSLTNLRSCQNLEEFCGNLHSHDLKTLTDLPNLTKLKFNKLESIKDFEYVLKNMNLSKLKYLSLFLVVYDKHFNEESLCDKLASQSFLALERLCIESMSKESLKQLIKNCPKLKSIQIPSGNYRFKIPNKVLCQIFKDESILIIFGKAIQKNNQQNTEQKSFEGYLVKHDLEEFKRYRRMREDFAKWCEANPGYGY